MAWHEGLTEKQRRFCEAYSANGGNAMRAATEAGYARPKQEGSRMLENAGIRTALELLRQETTNTAIATREERQSFWTSVIRDGDEDMRNRLKASELLGRSQTDFVERVDATTRIVVEHVYEGLEEHG
jgi:phage terminase small subunit